MKRLKIFVLLAILLMLLNTQSFAQTSCINCHNQLEDEMKAPTDAVTTDVHLKNGISCHNCHGGNPDVKLEDDDEAAMSTKMGYIGVPDRKNIPKLCSKCHSDPQYMRTFNPNLQTDQYQRYLTSEHGMKLAKGDIKVAVCTDCHGKHNIQPANSVTSMVFPTKIPETCGKCHSDKEYMQDYAIPTDQFELYKQSVHGINLFEKGDRFSPVCNDCHGNHGAVPPGIASISHVCGACHVSQVEMFSASPHEEAFAELELPQCESCHNNHAIASSSPNMLGVGDDALCIECHDEGTSGFQTAEEMKQKVDSLIYKVERADSLLEKAEKAGVEVSDGKFIARDAHDALIKARNSVHNFSLAKFDEVISPGFELVNNALIEGQSALKEVQSRRLALAIISVIIFIAAISLYLKIKFMENE